MYFTHLPPCLSTEGAWHAEEGLGRWRLSVQGAAVWPVHVWHPGQRGAVLKHGQNSAKYELNASLFAKLAVGKSTFTCCSVIFVLSWESSTEAGSVWSGNTDEDLSLYHTLIWCFGRIISDTFVTCFALYLKNFSVPIWVILLWPICWKCSAFSLLSVARFASKCSAHFYFISENPLLIFKY